MGTKREAKKVSGTFFSVERFSSGAARQKKVPDTFFGSSA